MYTVAVPDGKLSCKVSAGDASKRHPVSASVIDSISRVPVRSPRKRLLCHKREFEVDAQANRGILRFLRPCMLRFVGDVGSG